MLKKHLVGPFAQEYGVEVELAEAPDGFVPLLTAQANANQVKADLMDPSAGDAIVMANEGLLQKLPGDLKTFLIDELGEQDVTDYGVGFAAYSFVIASNPSLVVRCHTSVDEFWDVDELPGRRAMYGAGWDSMPFMALKVAGVPEDELYEDPDLDLAYEKLDEIKNHINVWWTTGDQSQQILRSEEVAMSIMWDGRAFAARDQSMPELEIHHDGMLRQRELIVVTKNAPNAEAAFAYLRWYATNPEAGSEWMKSMHYGVADDKALEYLPEDVASEMAVAPENLAVTTPIDADWTVENRQEALKRWQNWLGE